MPERPHVWLSPEEFDASKLSLAAPGILSQEGSFLVPLDLLATAAQNFAPGSRLGRILSAFSGRTLGDCAGCGS